MIFASDPTVPENWLALIQAGGTGACILILLLIARAFLSNQIVSGKTHEAEISRLIMDNAALRKELLEEREKRDQLAERAVPLLTEVAKALENSAQYASASIERQVTSPRMDVLTRRTEILADTLGEKLDLLDDILGSRGKNRERDR